MTELRVPRFRMKKEKTLKKFLNNSWYMSYSRVEVAADARRGS
jgi:hypothetical protein